MDNLLFFYWGWAAMLVGILALSLLVCRLFDRLFVLYTQRPDQTPKRHTYSQQITESQTLYLSEFGSSLGMNNATLSNWERSSNERSFSSRIEKLALRR